MTWTPGSAHRIRLEYFESTGNARLKLLWDAGVADDGLARIDEAVALARRSDVAIVVAGVEEGEFRDRAILGLPGRQEELIRRVAATGKPVIVVLIGGSAITMSPWLDQVARGRRRLVSRRAGRARGGGRPLRRRQSRRPAADHVPDGRGAAAAVVQPQADRTRRRLRRSHRHAALPVRLRPQLHDLRVFWAPHRPGGDGCGGHGHGPRDRAGTPADAPATKSCSYTFATSWRRWRGR